MAIRSGQWVILGMFACGLAATGFGMWYRYQTTRHCLELWGAPAVTLIARAPKIEALHFDPPLAATGPIGIDELRAQATSAEVVTGSRGMLNVREAFVEDSTFRWEQNIATPPAWSYALIFSNGEQQTAILYDPAAAIVGNPASGARVLLEPLASDDLAAFFREQFAAAKD